MITGREGKCGFVGFSDVILLLFEGGPLSFGEVSEVGEFCEIGKFCEFRGLGSPSIFYSLLTPHAFPCRPYALAGKVMVQGEPAADRIPEHTDLPDSTEKTTFKTDKNQHH